MSPQRCAREESGIALISVLGFSLIAMILVSAAISYSVRTMPQTRTHEDWNAALAAAEAGVDDVRYRLNQDPFYWASFDGDNPALTGWTDIPGGGGGQYTYRIESDEVARFGHVDVIASGRVRDSVRTVQVRVRREGFLDNIYFTDFDTSDPFVLATNQTQREYLDDICARYHPFRDRGTAYATPGLNGQGRGGCGTIRFAPSDVLTGPTRSNDAIMINPWNGNPQFLGPVRTGWDGRNASGNYTGQNWIRDGGVGQPYFRDGIETVARLPLPETTTSLADQAAATGCHYVGPTYIGFMANPPRMTIVSPLTPPSSVNPGCGPAATGGYTGIRGTVSLKDGEVLYASNAPSNPGSHPLGMSGFSARAGDIFVHGQVEGRVTVASENDVVVIHDLTYRDQSQDSDDLVGLISENNVRVHHPVSGSSNVSFVRRDRAPWDMVPTGSGHARSLIPSGSSVWTDAKIHAAVLALNRSFGVDNYGTGSTLGDLTVYGAIAQRFRGPVATGNSTTGTIVTGYAKDYIYDNRLRYLSPPYFLSPTISPWARRNWAELQRPDVCAPGVEPHEAAEVCIPALD